MNADNILKACDSELHVSWTGSQYYAAFRIPGADEFTPELGWAYGATVAEAVEAAVASALMGGDK
ncbi:hypothetical protein [Stenotrophomonas phage BUCT555]|nr:hypothetical protein [Stenotrophomonas phage BUCT555]